MLFSDFEFDVLETNSAPHSTIESWHSGFTLAFEKKPEFFCWIEIDDLRDPNTVIAVAWKHCSVVAGFRLTRELRDDSHLIAISSLFNTSGVPGLSKPLIATAIEREATLNPSSFDGIADVRVMPDGQVNTPSAAVLGDMGFAASDIARRPICDRTKHLLSSVEPDGTFVCLEMRARAHRLRARASSVLKEMQSSGDRL